jgi:phosphoglucosamine mutase
MFGTSGIRGIYGSDITEGLALKVANVFAMGTLACGRDMRESGIPLFHAVSAGAASAGADVVDLGIVPTPTVALAGGRGIMITASHNPPEYNGLKLVENGKEIGKELEGEIAAAYREGTFRISRKPGRVSKDTGIIGRHKDMVCGMVDAAAIAKRKPKVVVDCNGAAAVITPSLLSDLGCEVVSVNCSLESFARPSEPNEKNLSYLGGIVRSAGADFAIAHDGDGDRCAVFDETGTMLPLDVQLAMMIGHELASSKNKKIVSTVEASLTIREVVEKAGGQIAITPVGSTFVADELERSGALFGGEPCGEYVYASGVHVPDAVLAAAKFAEIFCAKGAFSKLKTLYPQNFMAREKFQAKDKHAAVAAIRKAIDAGEVENQGNRKPETNDGVRVDEEDGWFLIRASGTEPIVRLTMEYKTKDRLETRKSRLVALIQKSL